ncbi:MAG: DUF3822 family protein [Alistipes sp.]|nr:DUF3822 family protein [Alistipes sp.]
MAKEILSIRLSADGLSFWTGDHAEGIGTDGMKILPGAGEVVSADYPLLPDDGRSMDEALREAVSGFCGILQARGVGMPFMKVLYVDTLSTVLVPSAIFDEADAEAYLQLHGITAADDEYIVCSKPLHGTVAVMVAGKRHTTALGNAVGDFAVVSPLQYNLCTPVPAGGETAGAVTGTPAGSRRVTVYATPFNCYITAFDCDRMLYADVHPVSSAADLIFCLDWVITRLGFTEWSLSVAGHKSEELVALVSGRFKGCVCV